MNVHLLGGLSNSFFINKVGRTTLSHAAEKLVEDLKLFLSTQKGTLFGRPDYGCALLEMLFEPTTKTTGSRIQAEVSRALKVSYPNIDWRSVDIYLTEFGLGLRTVYSLNDGDVLQELEFDIVKEKGGRKNG